MIARASALLPVLLVLSCSPAPKAPDHSAAKDLVRRFIEAQERVMQPTAGDPEIQNVLALLTDSIAYEHPRARATVIGRLAYGQGLRSFVGTTRNPRITVVRALVSGPIVVTEQHLTFETEENGVWRASARTQITVFDIEDDRIARIVDFWQPAGSS